MRDPYLFEDNDVLKNKLGIINQELLEQAEADYVVFRMKEIALNPLPGDYHTEHFFRITSGNPRFFKCRDENA